MFERNAKLFFFTFFSFCYFLLLFFTARNFYKLLFTAETGVKFVTFLLFVTFINYFLLLRRARVYGVFNVQGRELKSVHVDFFPSIFFTVEGLGGWKLTFFFPYTYEKVEGGGGKGVHLGFLEIFFSLWSD